ncbi:MAG: phosphoribosylanthranilate isomerase [Xanthomonadales bacterium]|nr:phosphoribosylanthranilate isomerase [Xanthomonadales bacterium]
MNVPLVKFCGLTRAVDVERAARLGVAAIGLVLATGSPRRVGVDLARSLAETAREQVRPPRVVLLLRNAPAGEVAAAIAAIAPDLLQFHGDESEDECTRFGLPYWKALGLAGVADPAALLAGHLRAEALLLDGHPPGAAGGSGQRLDWRRWPAGASRRLVLAGGLAPGNIAAAIAATRPWAVDVSSGIESAPGIKDEAAMAAFMAAVAQA